MVSEINHRISHSKVFCKKVALKNLAKFTGKNLCLQACNFIKKELLTQVFFCKFCEIFKNTFFHRTPLVVASAFKRKNYSTTYIKGLRKSNIQTARTTIKLFSTYFQWNLSGFRKPQSTHHNSFKWLISWQ